MQPSYDLKMKKSLVYNQVVFVPNFLSYPDSVIPRAFSLARFFYIN